MIHIEDRWGKSHYLTPALIESVTIEGDAQNLVENQWRITVWFPHRKSPTVIYAILDDGEYVRLHQQFCA